VLGFGLVGVQSVQSPPEEFLPFQLSVFAVSLLVNGLRKRAFLGGFRDYFYFTSLFVFSPSYLILSGSPFPQPP